MISLVPIWSVPPSVSIDTAAAFEPSPAETLASRIRPSVESRSEKLPSVTTPLRLSTVLPELLARSTEPAVLTTSLLAASGPTWVTAPVMSPATPMVTVPREAVTVPSCTAPASRMMIADVLADAVSVMPAITMLPALASRAIRPVPASIVEPTAWVIPTPVRANVAVLPALAVMSCVATSSAPPAVVIVTLPVLTVMSPASSRPPVASLSAKATPAPVTV